MERFPKNINNLGFSSLGPNLTNNLDPGCIFSNWSKKPIIWTIRIIAPSPARQACPGPPRADLPRLPSKPGVPRPAGPVRPTWRPPTCLRNGAGQSF